MSATEREHHAPVDERLDALAQQFLQRAWQDGAESIPALREYLRDHAASLAEFARQVRDEYERVVGDEEVPTNAQGIALARFLRSAFRDKTIGAAVSRGSAGLPDDYVYVRLTDGYEAGIAPDGRVST